jgi:hypothetical protein
VVESTAVIFAVQDQVQAYQPLLTDPKNVFYLAAIFTDFLDRAGLKLDTCDWHRGPVESRRRARYRDQSEVFLERRRSHLVS